MATPLQIVQIDDFQIDATTNEDHDTDADVTQYPIEDGSDVVDNVHVKPRNLTLQCIVSDTPLAPMDTIRTPGSIPSHDAYNRMDAIMQAKQPITVITRRRVYTQMFMSKLSAPDNADIGDSLQFTVSFVQGKILVNQRINVRVALPVAPKKNVGTKAPTAKKSPDEDKGRVSIIQKLRGH